MNKKIVILLALTISLLAIPTAMAAPMTDEWLKQNAINGLLAIHPELDEVTLTAEIVSGWHIHPGVWWHKHVEITGTFGHKDSGFVYWTGRSYASGGIYTVEYSYVEPMRKPVVINTIMSYILGAKPAYYVDGRWVFNYPYAYSNPSNKVMHVTFTLEDVTRTYRLKPHQSISVFTPPSYWGLVPSWDLY